MCLATELRPTSSLLSTVRPPRLRADFNCASSSRWGAHIENHQRMLRLGLCLASALLAVSGWSCSDSSLPPLPDPALEDFAPPVQEQLRSIRAKAAAAPRDANAVGDLGRALYAYGQLQASAACFERSRKLAPEVFRWAYLFGVAQAGLGRAEQAKAAFEAASEMRPGDLPTALRLADLLEQTGDQAAAKRVLERVLEETSAGAAAHFRLGRLVAAEDSARAITHLEAAIRAEPDYREALYALASAYRLQGRHQEATAKLVLYENADPGQRRHYPDPLIDAMESIRASSAQQVFNEGHALQARGDYEGALAAYAAVLEIDPNYVQAHVNLVAVHGELGNYEQASQHYEQSVSLNPSISEAHYNYGVSLHFSEDYRGASDAFRRALEINPQDPNTHANLATSLEELGRDTEASRHYRLALTNNPAHPMANFHVGRRLADRGRYGEALAYLQKAVETETLGTALHAYVLALVHRALGQNDRARDVARRALNHAQARGQTDLAAKIATEFAL